MVLVYYESLHDNGFQIAHKSSLFVSTQFVFPSRLMTEFRTMIQNSMAFMIIPSQVHDRLQFQSASYFFSFSA